MLEKKRTAWKTAPQWQHNGRTMTINMTNCLANFISWIFNIFCHFPFVFFLLCFGHVSWFSCFHFSRVWCVMFNCFFSIFSIFCSFVFFTVYWFLPLFHWFFFPFWLFFLFRSSSSRLHWFSCVVSKGLLIFSLVFNDFSMVLLLPCLKINEMIEKQGANDKKIAG